MFCPSQIKNYIIVGLVSNFFIHLVTGWHILCRKEITIRIVTRILLCYAFIHISYHAVSDTNNTRNTRPILYSYLTYLPTYLIGHYDPSVRIIDLVSHTTYILCALILCAQSFRHNDRFLRNLSWQIYLMFFLEVC